MSKITAMYIRLSMEDEDVSLNRKEESNSVSSQRELLKAYIENHSELKDTKVQEYCDDGFTGTKFERPGYMKLMEDIRAEKISCIVVKDLSRLGRDYIEVGSLLEQILPLYQVRVIAVNDNYDSDNYDGSTGGMNVAFKNLIYMLYSRDLSNKICSAKHTRILNGENISGQLRYGYVKDPNDKHKIIVDPEAAEVVKLIFELTAQGKRKTEVANYLNAHGIDTPSAYKKRKGSKNFFHAVEVKSLWSTSSIRDILNDEVYLGKLIWNKTKKRVGSKKTDYKKTSITVNRSYFKNNRNIILVNIAANYKTGATEATQIVLSLDNRPPKMKKKRLNIKKKQISFEKMLIPVDIVQYSKNKSFKNAKTVWDKKGGGLRAIKKLKPNTTYYIRYSITTDVSTLKGYKKIGGIWSKTIKVKTKK